MHNCITPKSRRGQQAVRSGGEESVVWIVSLKEQAGARSLVLPPRRTFDAMHRGEKIMSAQTLLIWLFIGAVAGWLAGMIVKGGGFGLIGNIIVGIIGSVIGGWLFANFHIYTGGGIIGEILGATVGAVVLLFLIRLIRRA
jgi:uncharacterized membrane protein YeaQ/YmgE (transglycosylase-associated protein family)